MASTLTNLLRIEDYLERLLSEGHDVIHDIKNPTKNGFKSKAIDKVCSKFKLSVVSTEGTTRIILKAKGSKTVLKIGIQSHNKAEYALYKAVENSLLGKIFAPCLQISPRGLVLEMDYISRPIPGARGEYYWFNPEFTKIRNHLESQFDFVKSYNTYSWGADFHEENMRMDRKGNIKIVDYSNLLADMFSRRKATTVSMAIRNMLKLEFPKVNLNLYCKDRVIHYTNNTKIMSAKIDPESKQAC